MISGLKAGLIALAVAIGACQAEDSMQVTLDKPAVVTAKPATAAMLGGADIGARRVLLSVVGYTPPADKKPVDIVVRVVLAGGDRREVGRFAIVPAAPFGTADAARHQNFAFALPADLAGQKTLSLEVALVPVNGGGQGARLEVGSAAIH